MSVTEQSQYLSTTVQREHETCPGVNPRGFTPSLPFPGIYRVIDAQSKSAHTTDDSDLRQRATRQSDDASTG